MPLLGEAVSVLTAEYVRAILLFNPETGQFSWRKRSADMFRDGQFSKERACGIWNTRFAGKLTGHAHPDGGVRLHIDGKTYWAHRIAWLYAYGRNPTAEIDHKDGDSSNNKISNLREASRAENARNVSLCSANTSGFKGVSWHKRRAKWTAQIGFNKKQIHLGVFDRAEDAAAAYKNAASKLHGAFARLK